LKHVSHDLGARLFFLNIIILNHKNKNKQIEEKNTQELNQNFLVGGDVGSESSNRNSPSPRSRRKEGVLCYLPSPS